MGAPPTASTAVTEVGSTTTSTEERTTTSGRHQRRAGRRVQGRLRAPRQRSMAEYGAILRWQLDWFAKNVWKDGLLIG